MQKQLNSIFMTGASFAGEKDTWSLPGPAEAYDRESLVFLVLIIGIWRLLAEDKNPGLFSSDVVRRFLRTPRLRVYAGKIFHTRRRLLIELEKIRTRVHACMHADLHALFAITQTKSIKEL